MNRNKIYAVFKSKEEENNPENKLLKKRCNKCRFFSVTDEHRYLCEALNSPVSPHHKACDWFSARE